MGDFSTVCCFSKLPIFGNDVVNFILKANKNGSHCYPNWKWNIFSLPIFGTNDTYGRIEVDSNGKYNDANNKLISHYGLNISDLCVSRSNDDFAMMTIHRDIYDYIIKTYKTESKNPIKIYNRCKGDAESLIELLKKTVKTAYERGSISKECYDEMIKANNQALHPAYYEYINEGAYSRSLVEWLNESYLDRDSDHPQKDIVIDGLNSLFAVCEFAFICRSFYEKQWFIGEQYPEWNAEKEWRKVVNSIIDKNLKRH